MLWISFPQVVNVACTIFYIKSSGSESAFSVVLILNEFPFNHDEV
jgi:hypothetical protein